MIRLVIIDDHEMVREGLKAILVTEPDFSIVGEAANAEQALELIERLRPEIALLDGCIFLMKRKDLRVYGYLMEVKI